MDLVQQASSPVGVQMIQPIVPHYRVPFFEGVARRRDLRVSLSVSASIRGLPPSLPVAGMSVNARHPYIEIFGGRLLWQKGLTLDPRLGRGDVLVIDGNPRYLSTYPLVMAARRRGVAIMTWGHGWSATSAPLRARLRLHMLRLVDAVLVYTDAERDDLIARGFDPQRVFALNNALDDEKIAQSAAAWPRERLAEFRRAQALDDARLLLFCGRLRQTPSTDFDVALRALAELVVHDPRYVLAVIGDGVARDSLRGLAVALGVDAHVRWLGAIYDEALLAPWFLSADCFVYPGSIGLSLLQALGYGVPVVTHANRREHGPEIAALEDGVTGLTFARGDTRHLAGCVRRICENPALRTRMSAAARGMIRDNYSMSGMVRRFAAAVTAASRLGAAR